MQTFDSATLMMMMLAVVAMFTLMFILSGIKMVNAWERVVIFRLGKYWGIRGPGMIWKIPILDTIILRVSLREQSTDVDTGEYVATASSSHRLKGIVQWKIVDVEKFAFKTKDHYNTVNVTIQHNVMRVAESMSSDLAFSDSYELNSQLESALEPIFSEWGLTVTKVDLHRAPRRF